MRDRKLTLILLVSVVALVTGLVVLFVGGRPRNLATPMPADPTAEAIAETSVGTSASTSTGLPTASATVQEPLIYAVQPGDTLGAIAQAHGVTVDELVAANDIADPNVLQVGQALVIPQGTLLPPTAPPATAPPEATVPVTTAPLPTLTPAGPSLVEISQVLSPANPASEAVVVHNRGGLTDLEGWTISKASGETFTFPALTLFTDGQVSVHSSAGENTPSDLYWGRAEAVWNKGDLVTLRNAKGDIVDTYIVP